MNENQSPQTENRSEGEGLQPESQNENKSDNKVPARKNAKKAVTKKSADSSSSSASTGTKKSTDETKNKKTAARKTATKKTARTTAAADKTVPNTAAPTQKNAPDTKDSADTKPAASKTQETVPAPTEKKSAPEDAIRSASPVQEEKPDATPKIDAAATTTVKSAASATLFDSSGDMDIQSMRELLECQRTAFIAEGKVELGVRIDRINRCISLLFHHQKKIVEALNEDFRGRAPEISLMSDVLDSMMQLKHTLKHVRKWMRPQPRNPSLLMRLFGSKSFVLYQPKGVVGIMTPWNFPVNMIFNPLANILGAGNRAMIKPSEYNPATAALMTELFPRYFEKSEIAICNGGAETGAAFSSLPFDHLIFTGGTEIGRKVLAAAAPNLTPVTLELGGKSPVIIGASADIATAAKRIIGGKIMNSGQACISPDYVFVPDSRVEEFIYHARICFRNMYPQISGNSDYTSLINQKHYQRLQDWLQEARERGCRVEPLQSVENNDSSWRLPLHLLVEPATDLNIMRHEVFGPALSLRGYQKIEEALDFINARPHPLALYYFGKDRKEEQKILFNTRSGGVTINDVMMHAGCSDLPFGGIGESGMGNYHGFDGFRTFSHMRAVFRQGRTNLSELFGMLPPYSEKTTERLQAQIKE